MTYYSERINERLLDIHEKTSAKSEKISFNRHALEYRIRDTYSKSISFRQQTQA